MKMSPFLPLFSCPFFFLHLLQIDFHEKEASLARTLGSEGQAPDAVSSSFICVFAAFLIPFFVHTEITGLSHIQCDTNN